MCYLEVKYLFEVPQLLQIYFLLSLILAIEADTISTHQRNYLADRKKYFNKSVRDMERKIREDKMKEEEEATRNKTRNEPAF
jgi:hypothetical protein